MTEMTQRVFELVKGWHSYQQSKPPHFHRQYYRTKILLPVACRKYSSSSLVFPIGPCHLSAVLRHSFLTFLGLPCALGSSAISWRKLKTGIIKQYMDNTSIRSTDISYCVEKCWWVVQSLEYTLSAVSNNVMSQRSTTNDSCLLDVHYCYKHGEDT